MSISRTRGESRPGGAVLIQHQHLVDHILDPVRRNPDVGELGGREAVQRTGSGPTRFAAAKARKKALQGAHLDSPAHEFGSPIFGSPPCGLLKR